MAKAPKSVAEMRKNFADTASEFNEVPNDIKCEKIDDDAVNAEWITAPHADKDKVLLFLHGGGYIVCSVSAHREIIGRPQLHISHGPPNLAPYARFTFGD